MFAIIRTGGKQYKVTADQTLIVERLPGEVGDQVVIDTVLLVNDGSKTQVGSPFIEGSTVIGTILAQDRADKLIVFKKKRRHNYRRKQGHRQDITVLRIFNVAGLKKPEKATPVKAGTAEKKAKKSDAEPKKKAAVAE